MKNIYKIAGLAFALFLSAGFVACGGDSGTSAKDDESSISSSSIATNSSSSRNDNAKSSSSVVESSSSEKISSSSNVAPSADIMADGYYETNCPAGKTCAYAPTERLNSDITYGEFLDTRDYQVYKTIEICDKNGNCQIWMAQNLNYNNNDDVGASYCYDNREGYCDEYGRLYSWNSAKNACPSGWHLPSNTEWETLFDVVGGISVAGKKLKSTSGWRNSGNGDDVFGFAVLPAGYRNYYGSFYYAFENASFCSATEYSDYETYVWNFDYRYELVDSSSRNKGGSCSVRCIMNAVIVVESSSSVAESSSLEESSSSRDVILSSSQNLQSSSSAKSSSSAASSSSAKSSSSTASSSCGERKPMPYTTECPPGQVCTYAPTEQLNPKITYGELLDTRDYQVYKTVEICDGDNVNCQTWMAQNLNYSYTSAKFLYEDYSYTVYTSDSTSWCYNNEADFCAKYGRLYTWPAAIDSVALAKDADNPQTCGYDETCDRLSATALAANPIQGVCPSGWHLPSNAEWNALRTAVGDSSYAKALTSSCGWDGKGAGDDAYGFSALPAGEWYYKEGFCSTGYGAYFWSAERDDLIRSYHMSFVYVLGGASLYGTHKTSGYSVRCIKD